MVKIHIHPRQAAHERRDVVAGDVAGEFFARGGFQEVTRVRVFFGGFGRCIGRENVLEGGNQKSRRTSSGVKNGFVFLGVDHVHDEFNDVARGSELAVLPLCAHRVQQVFKGVAEFFGMVVRESIDFIEEQLQHLAVTEFKKGVFENAFEEFGNALVLHVADGLNSLNEFRDTFVAAQGIADEFAPGQVTEVADEKRGLAAQLARLLIDVIHEFVNQGDGNEFNLVGRQRQLADEYVAGIVYPAFGFLVEHKSETGSGGKVAIDDDVILDVIQREFALRLTERLEFAQIQAGVGGELSKITLIHRYADVGI